MSTINVSYAAMADGHDGLIATWGRIEGHLAELDHAVAGAADLQSQALDAYRALKAIWDRSADDRQLALRGLAGFIEQAAAEYRRVDALMAAQFIR